MRVMMKNYHGIVLVAVVIFVYIHDTQCAAIGLNPMYDVLIQNCKFLQNQNQSEINSFKKQPIFAKCLHWDVISSMKSVHQVSGRNKDNIRCLLYYESFISFCNHLNLSQSTNILQILSQTLHGDVNITSTCKDLSLLPREKSQSQQIHNVITTENACTFICLEYIDGNEHVNDICADAFDFNNVKVERQPIKISKTSEIKVPSGNEVESTSQLENKGLPKVNPEQPKIADSNPALGIPEPNSINVASGENVQNQKQVIVDQNNPIPTNPGGTADKTDIPKSENPETDTNIKPSLVTPNAKLDIPKEGNGEIESDSVKQKIKLDSQNEKSIDLKITTANADLNDLDEQNAQSGPNNLNQLNQDLNNKHVFDDQQPMPPGTNMDVGPHDYENSENVEKFDEKLEQPEVQENKDSSMQDQFKAPKTGQPYSYDADMDGNSPFFSYFSFVCVAFVIGYVGYHNKQKVLALLVEGRSSRRPQRGRRPNCANYHKLDSNLEEAISSSCAKTTSPIIY